MADTPLSQALENIYTALNNDNEGIDLQIAELKKALNGEKNVTVDPKRLAENTRQGRRYMQAYFKKHGVLVTFS